DRQLTCVRSGHGDPSAARHTGGMPLEFPLRGPRLDLRPFTATDAADAQRVYGDPEVMRHVGEGGPASEEQTAVMLADYAAHQARHGFAFWAVIERGTGRLTARAATPRGHRGCRESGLGPGARPPRLRGRRADRRLRQAAPPLRAGAVRRRARPDPTARGGAQPGRASAAPGMSDSEPNKCRRWLRTDQSREPWRAGRRGPTGFGVTP